MEEPKSEEKSATTNLTSSGNRKRAAGTASRYLTKSAPVSGTGYEGGAKSRSSLRTRAAESFQ
eukprot:3922658-Prymnesium_polylepis.1